MTSEKLAAAVKHLLHCAMAAHDALERGDDVERLRLYVEDARKWSVLAAGDCEDADQGKVREFAGRLKPRMPQVPEAS